MDYGATPLCWLHWHGLGLTEDLLPVVSNPNATISSESKMKGLGKTPSRYNRQHHVAGIADWTSKRTTLDEINQWSKNDDYGICLQTRRLRAIDIDITDAETARRVVGAITPKLPARTRGNSPKSLLCFNLPGDYTKRIIRTQAGNIEFLATGQQFVACGTHPSGVRYEWEGGYPDEIPTLSPEQFEALWAGLQSEFGIADSVEAKPSSKHAVLLEAHKADPVAVRLFERQMVFSAQKDGALNIECPFAAEHTTDSGETATQYYPAHTGGFEHGNFKCLHAHCEGRTRHEFMEALGLDDREDGDFAPLRDSDESQAVSDDWRPLVGGGVSPAPDGDAGKPDGDAGERPRFQAVAVPDFKQRAPLSWIVKSVIPRGALGMIFGDSASGKTFFALDLAGAIAEGTEWRGHKVEQGRVVYIAAEGVAGLRSRLLAYCEERNATLANLGVIADAPNFTVKADVEAIYHAVMRFKDVSVIFVDTLAQVTAGANENSAEDMGKMLKFCRQLHKQSGAMVILIHHSGKDATKGARGSSVLRPACDVEIEVERADARRSATITKMKDGEDGMTFGFELKTVVLGEDEEGEAITSCVIEPTDQQRVEKKRRERPLGPTQEAVLNLVKEGIDLVDGGVNVASIVAAYKAQVEAPEGRDTRSAVVRRALEALVGKSLVKVEGDVVQLFTSD